MTNVLIKPVKLDSNEYTYYLNGEFSWTGACASAAASTQGAITTGVAVGVATGSVGAGIAAGAAVVCGAFISGGLRR